MEVEQLDDGCCGGSCGPEAAGDRPDRPHTFFAHEMTRCPDCGDDIEARVVLRDGAVFHLIFCPDCGESEEQVHDDAAAFVDAFIDAGMPGEDADGEDHFFKETTSTCPECLQLLVVDVVVRDGRVYFKKDCPDCGPSEALVSENAEYYVDAYRYARAGTEPFEHTAEVDQGCPTDCGTCANHEQHTCLPIVEITDHCNLECPVCIVNNLYSNHMSRDDFRATVDNLVESEGFCESIALSGGEPTSHPHFMDFVDIATRDEIGRVVVITNGLRLGRDDDFAKELKQRGAYVALQFDGFSPEAHTIVRGRDLTAEKEAALSALKKYEIPTQIIYVAVQGVNDHQIGDIIELFLSEDHFLSLNFQPMAHSGHGGGDFEHDPMDRVTIPGVIERAEEQTDGFLKMSDFNPLPCSHPQCVSLTYLLKLNDGSYVPFPRFVDFDQHGSLLRSSATLVASPEIEDTMLDVIHHTFAHQDSIERGPEILKALRRCVDEMFPPRPMDAKEAMRAGEDQAKSIFLHHYMDRHDFDLERLRKCCHHYAEPDGRIMPACGFNMFHRGAAKGPETETAEWGEKPAIQRAVDAENGEAKLNAAIDEAVSANSTNSSCGTGCGCDDS